MRFLFANLLLFDFILIKSVADDSSFSCAFDCFCNHSLMFCAVTCNSTRNNFSCFSQVSFQFRCIFVIDFSYFVCAKTAVFALFLVLNVLSCHVFIVTFLLCRFTGSTLLLY